MNSRTDVPNTLVVNVSFLFEQKLLLDEAFFAINMFQGTVPFWVQILLDVLGLVDRVLAKLHSTIGITHLVTATALEVSGLYNIDLDSDIF